MHDKVIIEVLLTGEWNFQVLLNDDAQNLSVEDSTGTTIEAGNVY